MLKVLLLLFIDLLGLK